MKLSNHYNQKNHSNIKPVFSHSKKTRKKINFRKLVFVLFLLVMLCLFLFFLQKKFVAIKDLFTLFQYNQSLTNNEADELNTPNYDVYMEFQSLSGTIEKQSDKIIIHFEDGSKAYLPVVDDSEAIRNIYGVLKKIRQKYTIENKAMDIIDLRYSRPIIKLKN